MQLSRLTVYAPKAVACALVLLSCWLATPGFAEKLTVDVAQIDNALHIRTTLGRKVYAYKIDAQDMIVQKLKTIYYLLEPKESETGTIENTNRFLKQQFKVLQGLLEQQDDSKQASPQNQLSMPGEIRLLLENVGQSLFSPIHSYIDAATQIEFVIAEDEMLFPLDALFYQGSPLFLHKPVIYRFSRKSETHFAVSKDWNGCLISDPVSDSGKAVLHIKEYFPNSRHFNSQKVCYEDIQKMGSAKFLLLSANGGPEGIELPQMAIRSWSLTPLKPELVYLDTGKLGLSIDFIKAFQQAGTRYYIAPIFIYESDNVSALTMERFFRAISKGTSPSYAMYLTRKTLYDEHLLKDNDFKWVMCQAFPFRIYQLN